MAVAVGGHLVAAGGNFANKVREALGEPAEHKKGASDR